MSPPASEAQEWADLSVDRLVDRIDALLPQTQCQRCGYPDCRAYAQALVDEAVPLNRCPPGGPEGVQRLADVLNRPTLPLDPDCGEAQERYAVRIVESQCIGCTLCIQACPVDCIVGGPKRMHSVIEADCTGCELCLPACPVDCITSFSVTPGRTGWDAWTPDQAEGARQRYLDRQARQQRQAKRPDDSPVAELDQPGTRQAILAAALAKARRLRGGAA
ncbi:RnfABCDGE type electron transport complex subunit B [Amphibiibacter pelophylacis]|uniref:RnfABCDGE type electron transport complex subunit B n=1 Tax=Amphibiibacter pelophylacis TaxID=1799477 RepID=A0ACC6P3H0_9BURK